MDDLGLEQADHRFGERVVVGISHTADRRLDAGLGEPLAVFDRDVLGRIQTVVATPWRRRLRWALENGGRIGLRLAPLPSPGRPPGAGRDERSRFWLAIASGMSSEDAALEAGVSQPVGTRWFRKAGGMPPAIVQVFGEAALRAVPIACGA